MQKDEKIKRLDFNDEFLLESAEKRFEGGDYLGALKILNKREKMNEPSADAYALYADVYEAMGVYSLAADAWFRFLDTCNEADFSEGYEGLAVAFMNMGDEMQSAFYYHCLLAEDSELSEEGREAILNSISADEKPKLRIVHSEGTADDDTETYALGVKHLRFGELEEAKAVFAQIGPESADYSSAAGLSAMCTLLSGDEEQAERECEELLKEYPENVQALTTYCAVLDARGNTEGAKEAAKKLAGIKAESTEDYYRIATALCETGLDQAAFEKLTVLLERLPYDNNVLYFYAVAAYHTGALKEAADALDRLVTVYPRAAVAEYYLVRLRELMDGKGEEFSMKYYYRVPEEEYRTIADFLLTANSTAEASAEELCALPELEDFFRIAFDEMERRDKKLQLLAAKVAVKCRSDRFVREMLLDYEGDEVIKLSVLHDLTMRNEEESYGVVILNHYKEFYTHKIQIGNRKRKPFMRAFADVYSKYSLFGEDSEDKIINAAEDVYYTLQDAEAWECMDERSALAAVIYREAHIRDSEHSVDAVSKLFEANVTAVKDILNFLI